jgi:hypothetical protein
VSTTLRRTAAVLLAVAVTVAIAGLSRVPYAASPTDDGVLRLSWRIPGEMVETCRQLTEEEIARRPVHMRREVECERRVLPYTLTVRIGGEMVMRETVQPGRGRGVRPLGVHRELPLPPGAYEVEVVWYPEMEDLEAEVDAERSFRIATALRLDPGDVALVTYDTDRRAPTALGPGVEGYRLSAAGPPRPAGEP